MSYVLSYMCYNIFVVLYQHMFVLISFPSEKPCPLWLFCSCIHLYVYFSKREFHVPTIRKSKSSHVFSHVFSCVMSFHFLGCVLVCSAFTLDEFTFFILLALPYNERRIVNKYKFVSSIFYKSF